ncbi:PhzF family phenazine biosynthesis protein [Kocuria palustris]|uniref:PhzF family phenazine biosynthesis protein n=1 Tax=Kocuria palustris TaxID=71999 RepID=UPI0011A02021|nr:PhzF family phenazine biosynthesis protein [Kocuria palustris]
MTDFRFSQVDVFSAAPHGGNPLAVVHNADELTDEQMARFANWTNLSETAFLLSPEHEHADYRVRIFTPQEELPFAGHPTLGSARAWLEAGGAPRPDGTVVQECGAGLITVLSDDDGLSFSAPPLRRGGEVESATLAHARQALGLSPGDVQGANWVDNGPGWLGLVLADARKVLALEPEPTLIAQHDLRLGVFGPHEPGRDADVEVRAFVPMETGMREDPVTGSLQAGFGTWLIRAGLAPEEYTAAQGTALGRSGRVRVRSDGQDVWVGGAAEVTITGIVSF